MYKCEIIVVGVCVMLVNLVGIILFFMMMLLDYGGVFEYGFCFYDSKLKSDGGIRYRKILYDWYKILFKCVWLFFFKKSFNWCKVVFIVFKVILVSLWFKLIIDNG